MKKFFYLPILIIYFLATILSYNATAQSISNAKVTSKKFPMKTSDKTITISFSSNIKKGNNFNKITLVDKNNKKISISLYISNNTLKIIINNSLKIGKYNLAIPKGALADTKGDIINGMNWSFNISDVNLSGAITLAGSTSVQPLADELAKLFMQRYPKVSVNVQGGGSSVGIKAAINGVCDIGTSSRELTKEEASQLKEFQIAIDGITVVVHSSNSISNLTIEQIKDIFAGKIKNWKEVGGNDAKIIVVTREEGSGTRGAFQEIVMGKEQISDSAIVQPSTGAVKQTVSQDKNSIGYISLGSLDETVKALRVDSVEATEKNIKNGTYKLKRPFLFLTKNEPKGLVKAFIDFALSDEGQNIVSKNYINVR